MYSCNVLHLYLRRFQINNLTTYLNKLGKDKQAEAKANRRQEIIKMNSEISKIERQKRKIKGTKDDCIERKTKLKKFELI